MLGCLSFLNLLPKTDVPSDIERQHPGSIDRQLNWTLLSTSYLLVFGVVMTITYLTKMAII